MVFIAGFRHRHREQQVYGFAINGIEWNGFFQTDKCSFDVRAALDTAMRNRYTITLKGSLLKVVQNEVLIQDLDLSKTGLKDRPAKGHISFQDEAKRVWYRNVRIKELK